MGIQEANLNNRPVRKGSEGDLTGVGSADGLNRGLVAKKTLTTSTNATGKAIPVVHLADVCPHCGESPCGGR